MNAEILTHPLILDFLLCVAVALDLALGDPRNIPHPVRLIGMLCDTTESFYRDLVQSPRMAGVLSFFTIIIVSGGLVACILLLASALNVIICLLLSTVLFYFFIAVKDLFLHSRRVHDHLVEEEGLSAARKSLALIVGRDTANLEEEKIITACVETVVENMVDGITAPLFWAVVFSFLSFVIPLHPVALAAIGMTLYKAINTMDSMFGYKNERYIDFGRFAARVDDVVNFIPARLSGLCIILGAFVLRLDGAASGHIFFRDRLNHASPNAGHSEAAAAGALGIQLGGPNSYFGNIVFKPFIGDALRPAVPSDILKANRLTLVSSAIFLSVLLVAGYICVWLICKVC